MGKTLEEVKKELLADDTFRQEYDAMAEEFTIASRLIEARSQAHLTQSQVAQRMGTTQSVVARLESGHPVAEFEVADEVCRGGREKDRDTVG